MQIDGDVFLQNSSVNWMFTNHHPELSGCITTLSVEVANFCAAMDTLIDQDDESYESQAVLFGCGMLGEWDSWGGGIPNTQIQAEDFDLGW